MPRQDTGRWAARVAYDSPVPQTMLAIWYVFVVSALTVLTLVPYLAFELVVGWQPTPLAVLLGALACAVAGPALRGLLGAMSELVDRRYYPGAPVRRFCASITGAGPGLRTLWAGLPVLVLFLAFDVALYGALPGVRAVVAVLGALMMLLLIGATVIDLSDDGAPHPPLRILTGAARQLARRWHVHLAWLLLLVVAVALVQIPLVGPSVLLLLPGGWAAAALVVERAFPAR